MSIVEKVHWNESVFTHLSSLNHTPYVQIELQTYTGLRLLKPLLHPQATGLVFVHLGLVGASLRLLVLGLPIAVVDPFSGWNAEWFRMCIEIYLFLCNPRQI